MKRRLLIIAVFLLLGAVVNVAVAWGCAYCPKPTARRRYAMPTPDQVAWWEARAPDGVESEPLIVATMPPSFGCLYQSLGGCRPDPDIGKEWRVAILGEGDGFSIYFRYTEASPSDTTRLLQRGLPPWDYAHQVQAGWPLTSVEGERWEIGVAYRAQPMWRSAAVAHSRRVTIAAHAARPIPSTAGYNLWCGAGRRRAGPQLSLNR